MTLFGKYKLLKQIARGGMAEIFMACIGSIKGAPKFVVIKRIIYTQSKNKEFNKMFQNEGRIAANLNHSNIASIHEFGVEDGQYFICMEYISGRNLRQLVKKLRSQKRQLSVEECTYIIRNACLGLDYAHNCTDSVTGQPLNIIHRDISPQNIMISFNGDIKVIDFGIAKIDDSEATKVGVLKGKFEYMSPEQVRGKVLDRQTDIFSMGSILWELLAGKKLFTGSDPIQILKKIKVCNIPNLKSLRPELPDRIVEIINRALQANKNLRYATMDEFGNDLSVFLNQQYPQWTQNHFGSFIKNIYTEEILEERNNLRLCAQKLEASSHQRKWSFLSRNSRAEDIQMGGDTFLSSPDEKDDKEVTRTMTQRELEQTNATHVSGNITETEFDDSLEREIPLKKPRFVKTNEYFYNPIQTSANNEVFKDYNPYTSMIRNKNRKRLQSSKKFTLKYPTYALFIASLFIGGFYLFKSGVIKKFPQLTQVNILELFNVDKEGNREVAADEAISPPEVQPQAAASSSHKKQPTVAQRRPVPAVRNVFLDTNPSGAQFSLEGDQKITGVTPHIQTLPADRRFKLTLKKAGFLDKTVVVTPEQVKKGQLLYRLKKDADRGSASVIISK